MAQTFSTELAGIASQPVVKPAVPAYGGRLRRYRATIAMASQSITTGNEAILAKIPAGQAFAFAIVNTSVTTGATTVAIGNGTTPALYAATAAYTTVDTPVIVGKNAAVAAGAYASEETILATSSAALAASGNLVIDIYTSQA
jgi:hypothetical protein